MKWHQAIEHPKAGQVVICFVTTLTPNNPFRSKHHFHTTGIWASQTGWCLSGVDSQGVPFYRPPQANYIVNSWVEVPNEDVGPNNPLGSNRELDLED